MIYLFWSLLTAALWIYFISIFFKGIEAVIEKLGGLAAAVFLLGLLQFCNVSKRDTDDVKKSTYVTQEKIDQGKMRTIDKIVDENLMFNVTLNVDYGPSAFDQKVVVNKAYVDALGIFAGYSWEPENVLMMPTDDPHKFIYSIGGTTQWYLLGLPIMSQDKHYDGFIDL